MLAHIQRALPLILLALAVVFGWNRWQAGQPVLAVVGALLILGVHGPFMLLEMAFVALARRGDPTPPARVSTLLRACWHEFLATPRVFYWRLPWRHGQFADHLPADARGHTGVLLVHGFVCNRGVWNPWLQRLQAQGVPFVAVNLTPVMSSIDDYARSIEDGVRRLEAATGVPPVAVAHSMGGLALRRWRADQLPARLHAVLTIATPHQGTWLARFAFSRNGRQMQHQSAWLRALAAREADAAAAAGIAAGPYAGFTCFYGDCDNVVFPPRAATLPGADNRLVPGVAHVAMLDRPEPWMALQAMLQAPPVDGVAPRKTARAAEDAAAFAGGPTAAGSEGASTARSNAQPPAARTG
jgi:triacylglycerol lipase